MTEQRYEPLIDILRSELKAYGQLLRLLEEQRMALMQQDAEAILSLSESIELHSEEIKTLHDQRIALVADLHPRGSQRLLSLIELVEGPALPLFEELVREISRLIKESHRQLTRNQMLYRRAWDITQETLRVLNPKLNATPGTYKRNGYTSSPVRGSGASYVTRTA